MEEPRLQGLHPANFLHGPQGSKYGGGDDSLMVMWWCYVFGVCVVVRFVCVLTATPHNVFHARFVDAHVRSKAVEWLSRLENDDICDFLTPPSS